MPDGKIVLLGLGLVDVVSVEPSMSKLGGISLVRRGFISRWDEGHDIHHTVCDQTAAQRAHGGFFRCR